MACRLCGEKKITTLMDMGEHPIAHDYLINQNSKESVYSFIVCFCENCGLIQLTNPISPNLLYTDYVTLSSWKSQPHIPRFIEMLESYTKIAKNSKSF